MSAIRKHDGSAMPCDAETLTVVKYRGGEVSPCALPARARQWTWPLGTPEQWNIIAWREANQDDRACA